MTPTNDFILTLDIDWAPDFMIDQVAQIMIENKVKTTWFVTHESEAVKRLRKNNDLFELGIHPNMLDGSTHGKTEDEVLTHMKNIVPEAISMRTHGLYQTSSFLIKSAKEYGILNDVSLFLPRCPNLYPFKMKFYGSHLLWRIPYFYEDDLEIFEDDPIWSLSDPRLNVSGLKVFNFHPVHIVLNTESFERYENLKKIRPLNSWDEKFIKEHANRDKGPKSLFLDLVYVLSGKGKKIKEIVNFENI